MKSSGFSAPGASLEGRGYTLTGMSEDNWLAILAVLGPLVGAAVGAIWATFSPRSTQQRLKEALEIEQEMPAEYKAEWRTRIDYLVANEAFNDRLVLQGVLYIALGYGALALGFVTEGLARSVLLVAGIVLIAVG